MSDGEITVQAASNGRRLTLDPIMPRDSLCIEPIRVESSIPAGFRQTFLSGENDEVEMTLTSGAGWGSPYLTLSIKVKETGERIEEVIDMRDVTAQWVDAALAAGPSPKWDSERGEYVT